MPLSFSGNEFLLCMIQERGAFFLTEAQREEKVNQLSEASKKIHL